MGGLLSTAETPADVGEHLNADVDPDAAANTHAGADALAHASAFCHAGSEHDTPFGSVSLAWAHAFTHTNLCDPFRDLHRNAAKRAGLQTELAIPCERLWN